MFPENLIPMKKKISLFKLNFADLSWQLSDLASILKPY